MAKSQWNPPSKLPPGKETKHFGPYVWLLLSDGTVRLGQPLFKSTGRGIHSWFTQEHAAPADTPNHHIGCAKPEGLTVVGWQEIARPEA